MLEAVVRGLVALAQEAVAALFGLSERGGVFGRLAKRGQYGIELQVVVARRIRCRSRTVRSSPSVTERTGTSTGGSPAYRRSTGSTPKCQLQQHVTHYVRIGSSQNQPGAENAMGEAENSHAEAHDLSGRPQEDRRSAADEVGESESKKSGLIVWIRWSANAKESFGNAAQAT